ncbi:hypothetical protein GCM10009808_13520 [Microbacterium sediminicola]|uniref:HEPN AbiU2-like domain-containing protein n=1 Tax=Microbacterium sediminicola TaxID=415210 RepID=A0ABP4U2Q9_9MICO
MRVPRFTSEYSDSQPSDEPMSNAEVTALVQTLASHEDSEAAQQNLVLRSVKDFYHAKYFWLRTRDADYKGDDRLKRVTKHFQNVLFRQAVVSIATAMDTTLSNAGGGDKAMRTASLPQMLDRVASRLDSAEADTTAAKELMSTIKERVDPERHPVLKYVRHMRNKWAGHASLDIRFDDWEGGASALRISHLESALARIVNAFEDYADLVEMSDALTSATTEPPRAPVVDSLGRESIPLRVDWFSVGVAANVVREATDKDVDRFVAVLVAGSNLQS